MWIDRPLIGRIVWQEYLFFKKVFQLEPKESSAKSHLFLREELGPGFQSNILHTFKQKFKTRVHLMISLFVHINKGSIIWLVWHKNSIYAEYSYDIIRSL